MPNCVTTGVVAGIQRQTLADKKGSSGIASRMVADAFGLPDKDEVDGFKPSQVCP